MDRVYMCIDLKSFYASVECVERSLNPLKTNLVVADLTRTEKTICLAVSPSLKSYGISGRARLYEVISKVNELNKNRFGKKSFNDDELKNNNNLKIDFIVAKPRMSLYIKYSTQIYNIYLKYISKEDILVYSIDEVFCDITDYLKYYNMSSKELVMKIIKDVYDTTGITATAGIGTNMYLAKVAMDIVAKHMEPNEYGVRLANLDVYNYRKLLWDYKPLTSFWRVGKGYQKKLNEYNMNTMGDIARMSILNEDLLFKLFGVNAEILIDHAWGYEPVTIKLAKSYHSINTSISKGQVLSTPYPFDLGLLITKEMTDNLVLELVEKHLLTSQIVLNIGYDIKSLNNYKGEVSKDFYGRKVPKDGHGTINIDHKTSSTEIIMDKVIELYNRIVDKNLLIRRINVIFANVVNESDVSYEKKEEQLDLFHDYKKEIKEKNNIINKEKKERKVQNAIIDIQKKYGKNAILKGMNYEKGATGRERNNLIGGHKE